MALPEYPSVLLVDDHTIVRVGIQMLLQLNMPNVRIAEASSGKEMQDLLKSTAFDIVILDINMPDTDTHNHLYTMKVMYPDLKVLIYSMSPEEVYAVRFVQLGIHGFLSKDAPKEELLDAIRTILAGNVYFTSKTMKMLAGSIMSGKPGINVFGRLSNREFEIMTHLIKGKTIKEISGFMQLHPSTIGTQKARILNKLQLENIIELKKLAEINNIVT